MKKIAIASDHAGYQLKGVLKTPLIDAGYIVNDSETGSDTPGN